MPSTGTNVSLGETRRKGIDLQASTRIGSAITLWASHSVQEAGIAPCIHRIRHLTGRQGSVCHPAPHHQRRGGLPNHRSPAPGPAGPRARQLHFIDDLNAQGKFGDFVLLDFNARYALTKAVSVDLQVKNLTNRKFAYVWWDNSSARSAQPMYSPARAAGGLCRST